MPVDGLNAYSGIPRVTRTDRLTRDLTAILDSVSYHIVPTTHHTTAHINIAFPHRFSEPPASVHTPSFPSLHYFTCTNSLRRQWISPIAPMAVDRQGTLPCSKTTMISTQPHTESHSAPSSLKPQGLPPERKKHASPSLLKRTRPGFAEGGIAISFENPSRRNSIAQQLFIRQVPLGLQGSYNAYSEKHGFRVPHGDVLVFALSFLLRPDTPPKSYTTWINVAEQLPKEAVSINRDMVRSPTLCMAMPSMDNGTIVTDDEDNHSGDEDDDHHGSLNNDHSGDTRSGYLGCHAVAKAVVGRVMATTMLYAVHDEIGFL
ncbi:hypothetical protein EDB85DRAFT_1903359 [Lactarius pseudohatsudake]|nr:hypothetical protein EDB85DRAFT_1903359 [Lactarius pseudohatsudake]